MLLLCLGVLLRCRLAVFLATFTINRRSKHVKIAFLDQISPALRRLPSG